MANNFKNGKGPQPEANPASYYGGNTTVTRKAEDILVNKLDWVEKKKTAQNNLNNAKGNFPLDESLSPERTLTK